jgi:hypothetical protein
MIKTWPVGVCSRSADISEWWPDRAFSPSPPACTPTATPPVKMAATTATAPAAIATDAAIRFRRFSGQRHLARDSEVGGAVPVTSAVGVLAAAGVGSVVGSPVAVGVGSAVGSLVAAGVGSVVSFEFGSGGVSLGPRVSVISSSLPTDVMRRMCRSEVDAVIQAGGFAAHDPVALALQPTRRNEFADHTQHGGIGIPVRWWHLDPLHMYGP